MFPSTRLKSPNGPRGSTKCLRPSGWGAFGFGLRSSLLTYLSIDTLVARALPKTKIPANAAPFRLFSRALKHSGILLLSLLFSTLCFAESKPPQVFLRIYTQTDANGSPNSIIPIQLTQPDDQIYVSAIPEASEKDLLGITAAPGAAGGAILHFNEHAGMNLDAATSQGDGKIMVVVLDGRVIYSPMIDTTIKNDLLIPRGILPQEFSLLQAVAKQNLHDLKR